MKKKIWTKRRQSRGFTLLEIVVAILILTVALLGLASLTSTIINGNFFNKTLTVATTLAKDKLEELKSEPLMGTAIPASYNGTDYRGANLETATSTNAYFTRNWSASGTDPVTITVTVTWPTNRSVVLKTIRARD
ncbi:MAG: prepilin-type N-terminal cleavage/methylation domain-containing protein [Smithella sp.]|jgi:type IV pilus assembly protein PilV|nr:prepilin-type N-terminal cleavage/methylation domain-containing protein [Smithellaceae bacterium]NLA41030.1 prepilin-type N-terminal cleavage/methylation domain-containing protein [Smithella sp.]